MQRVVNRRTVVAAVLVTAAFLGMFVGATVAGADGLIIVAEPIRPRPDHFSFAPLSVAFHRVSVAITDLVAVTTIDQEFQNPEGRRLEGTYVFPLPKGAVIDRFSLEVNGKLVEAELLPADRARAIYEEVVRQAKDPALLEYVGQGAFRARIFPIEPHGRTRVRISYTQLLASDGGVVEYLYPLNTEKFSSAPVRAVSVTVTVDGTRPLKSVWCPSHDAEVRRDGERRAVVGWEARDAWPDTDFRVVFSRAGEAVGLDLLTFRKRGEDGYFLLLASPGLVADPSAVQPKDVCFVLDTSGSMADGKLDQARRALTFCLASLDRRDRFEIVRFSTEAEPLFGGLAPADPDHLARAASYLASLKPQGGTAIASALEQAAGLRSADRDDRLFEVVFLTDGLPTVGETREDRLVDGVGRSAGSTRIFSFGIGTDVNTHLLDRLAAETRGLSRYVVATEDVEVAVSAFWSKVSEPVFSSIELAFGNAGIGVSRLLPAELPDLFNGDQLVVFGRYAGSGASTVRLSGRFAGRRREFVDETTFPSESTANAWIARLWAARRVGWILDEIRLRGQSGELIDEVTRLARQFGIVTPYTAYLVLEDEARRGVPVEVRSFRDLAEDRAVASEAKLLMDSVRREAAAPEARTGAGAVANAQALQGLSRLWNESQVVQAASLAKTGAAETGFGYRAAQKRNYATQVRVVGGRAFYQNGDRWTDANAQRGGLKQLSVPFAGEAWFALLRAHPQAAAWLSLGADVDVVIDEVLYQVRED